MCYVYAEECVVSTLPVTDNIYVFSTKWYTLCPRFILHVLLSIRATELVKWAMFLRILLPKKDIQPLKCGHLH